MDITAPPSIADTAISDPPPAEHQGAGNNAATSKPKILRDGFLIIIAYFTIYSWSRWVSPNGWAAFYWRAPEETLGLDGKMRRAVAGRTSVQDGVHLAWVALAVWLFWHLDTNTPAWNAFTLAMATFRLLDLAIDLSMLAVFGNRYGRGWTGVMHHRRLQRTLLINVLLVLELVFWNACWIFLAAKISPAWYSNTIDSPAQALHLSMATVTTIGYGNYAPVATPAILAAFGQALSALLLVTGVIAGVVSRISSAPEPKSDAGLEAAGPTANGAIAEEKDVGPAILWDSGWGWIIRWIGPILVPLLTIGAGAIYLLRNGIVYPW